MNNTPIIKTVIAQKTDINIERIITDMNATYPSPSIKYFIFSFSPLSHCQKFLYIYYNSFLVFLQPSQIDIHNSMLFPLMIMILEIFSILFLLF